MAHTELADRPWQFHLVNAPVVNAFNIPGGHVYVFTGLVEQAETLDEFAGVVAHEVAHGSARHGTQILTRAYGLSELLTPKETSGDSGVGDLAAAVLVLGYSRDAWSVTLWARNLFDERYEKRVFYFANAGPDWLATRYESPADPRQFGATVRYAF